jgi:hypothetical protein
VRIMVDRAAGSELVCLSPGAVAARDVIRAEWCAAPPTDVSALLPARRGERPCP